MEKAAAEIRGAGEAADGPAAMTRRKGEITRGDQAQKFVKKQPAPSCWCSREAGDATGSPQSQWRCGLGRDAVGTLRIRLTAQNR
jgi:hypothetical protein